MFYEDLKYRGIQWWLFPLLGMFSMGYSYLRFQSFDFLESIPWSLIISVLLLTSVVGLHWLKTRTPINKSLGMGDLLFLVAITPLFSTLEYLIFLSISFIGAGILHLLVQLIKRSNTVPLAGYQSLVLIGYLVLNYFHPISLLTEINQLALIL